jgi:Carbohydrate-selective porin, OprB family/S-layer homology domain
MKKLLFLGSILAASTVSSAAFANEAVPVSKLNGEGENNVSPYSTFQVLQDQEAAEQGQVTSVSQLSDVQPTDWAYQALQSLVERYGCIAGYPNGTFRGNRAATRYELAAALNACLDQISDRFATKEDLEAVKALQEEFKAELATLKGRVDSLEARSSVLEAQQFSTTTKLVGEAIFQGTIGAGDAPVPSGFIPTGVSVGDNFTFNYRATLNFLTSFTGKDLLITSLQQGNYPQNQTNFSITGPFSFTGLLGPQVAQANGDANNVALFNLQYRFPVFKDKGTVYAVAVGGELSDFVDTLNPNFDSDGQGALSAFGLRNPIYRQINNYQGSAFTGTGLGFNYEFSDKLSLGVGYLAVGRDAADAVGNGFNSVGAGLFGGDYGAIAQITFKPTKALGLGLTYVRSYSQAPPNVGFGGITGTIRANNPFGLADGSFFGLRVPTSAHSVGGQFSWEVSPRFALSGWAGATFANAESPIRVLDPVTGAITNVAPDGSDSTILNFALAASFPDLFGKGNMGGIIIGAEPSVISSSIPGNTDDDLPFHIEALYRFRVNDYISITPGVIAILNPEGNSANDPVIIGTIRTTFSF